MTPNISHPTYLGPGFEKFLLSRLDDDAVGVAHHGDQHVEQEDWDQDLGAARTARSSSFPAQIYVEPNEELDCSIYYLIIFR